MERIPWGAAMRRPQLSFMNLQMCGVVTTPAGCPTSRGFPRCGNGPSAVAKSRACPERSPRNLISSQFGHPTNKIVTHDLAEGCTNTETPLRARGVTGTQHSVQVADAGSNPAGSILLLVEDEFPFGGENAEIISPSNLTLLSCSPILIVDRVLRTT